MSARREAASGGSIYYENGKQRREKVGLKSAAIELYRKRKTEILEGRKLPPLKRTKPVTVGNLLDVMEDHVKSQHHKDQRTYQSRGEIARKALGARDAEALTPLGVC